MRINNNLLSLNTHRQLGITNGNQAKSMEKLSSGQRINRAGDDAAGLSISEKMRAQIRGLNMASKNAQDGISLIQTAEGALDESHAILQRMRELAVQSANDTNVAIDRGALQAEVDQLRQEIDRIAENTEFNTQKLLDGSFTDKKFHIGANKGQDITVGIDGTGAEKLGVNGTVYQSTDVTGIDGLSVASLTGEELEIEYVVNTDESSEVTAAFDKANGKITITLAAKDDGAGTIVIDDANSTHAAIKSALDKVAGDAGIKVSVDEDKFDGTTKANAAPGSTTVSTDEDKEASKSVGINISSQKDASEAIETINSAVESVSRERSKLGAIQNRLEHTIKNLDNSAENLQAAESRIRDVDMAKEMVNLTKQNILQQAAQAMLAQANSAPQGILQLLR